MRWRNAGTGWCSTVVVIGSLLCRSSNRPIGPTWVVALLPRGDKDWHRLSHQPSRQHAYEVVNQKPGGMKTTGLARSSDGRPAAPRTDGVRCRR